MRKLMLACAGAAAMSGILSVVLWRDLRHERELNALLQAQRQATGTTWRS